MKTITRFFIPLFVLAVLAASVVGVAFAKQIEVEGSQSDSSEIEFSGALEAIDASSWTVSGKVVAVTASTELKGTPVVGDMVKVHAFIADDGTLTAREIEPFTGSGGGNSNEDDDDSNVNGNSNEDDDDSNANGNSNEGQDDNSNANGNSNGNSNEDDDDSNSNGNSNEDDDDSNSNGNSNEGQDDDSNANGNSNGNSNEDDDDSNSNGNSNGNSNED